MLGKTISVVATSLVSTTIFTVAGAIAQVNTAPTQQQEKGSMNIGGSNLNLLQLMNSINLAGGKSPEQFRASQGEALDDAVSNFKNQQRREVKFSIPVANPETNK